MAERESQETTAAEVAQTIVDARNVALPRADTFVVSDSLEFAKTAARFPTATIRMEAPVRAAPVIRDTALQLAELIGEGGMGIVRAATQNALGRRVAVKSLREKRTSEDAVHLLREAWVTGMLEHPNIVPVYDLRQDEHGGPLLVLKLIDGSPWSTLLGSHAAVRTRFGVTDTLVWHLRVLVQVCQAIAMAHAKEILHRDLKPENILVGSFGQVYVADWGIAGSMKDDPSGRMPHLRELPLAGTPCYMAPEMWVGDPTRLGRHTDVYLLGGTLHEILTGRPPHDPQQFHDVRNLTAPVLALPNVPEELQVICMRALDPDPEVRFGTVDELRQKIEAFLDHRGVHELVRAASEKLHTAERLLVNAPKKGAPGERDGEGESLRMRVLGLISEARFGFREALAAWPENPGAREGLERAVRVGIDYELARGAAEAAESLLAELPQAPEDLRNRVADALRRKSMSVAALEKIRTEYDPNIGRTTRLAAALILGFFLIMLPHVFTRLAGQGRADPMNAYRADLVLLTVTGILAFLGRESLRKTAINRGFVRIALFLFGAQLAIALGTSFGPLAKEALSPMRFFGPLCALGAAAVLIEWRLFPACIGYLVAMFVEAKLPDAQAYVTSAANFVTVVCFAIAWFYPRRVADDSAGSPR